MTRKLALVFARYKNAPKRLADESSFRGTEELLMDFFSVSSYQ